MTLTAPGTKTAAARRFGYTVAILINAAFLYLINIWPSWAAVPFLTDQTVLVLDVVNASLVVSLAANALYLVDDEAWLRALGSIVTTAVGMVALLRILQVFPFDFADSAIDWSLIARIVLIVSVIGSAIGILVGFVTLVKSLWVRSSGGSGVQN